MASGPEHAKASVIAAVPTMVAVGMLTKDWLSAVCAGAGCLLGIFISPDLDLLEARMGWWEETLAALLTFSLLVFAIVKLFQ
jgi:hypothetical protein